HIVEPQRNAGWIEFRTAAVADRADDPPQIWIGREKCRLHQRRVCDRECDSARLRSVAAAIDVDRDEFCRALAVAHDRLRELHCDTFDLTLDEPRSWVRRRL